MVDNNNAMVHVLREDQARVNITYGGQNGDLPDPVHFESSDADIKTMLSEAMIAGSVPGIAPQGDINLRDFVVDRFGPTEQRPYNLIQLRPKTPFGIAAFVSPVPPRRKPNPNLTGGTIAVGCPYCGR